MKLEMGNEGKTHTNAYTQLKNDLSRIEDGGGL